MRIAKTVIALVLGTAMTFLTFGEVFAGQERQGMLGARLGQIEKKKRIREHPKTSDKPETGETGESRKIRET